MNKLYLALLSFGLIALASRADASPIPISVTSFQNNAGSSSCRFEWEWWGHHLGSAFQEMLITDLNDYPQFEIFEREVIRDVLANEHDLPNSEHSSDQPRRGHFKKARYTFAGSVSEFEYCAGGGGGSLDVGRLLGVGSVRIGAKGGQAKVAVDIRIIEVETGRIVATARGEGKASDRRIDVGMDVGAVSGDLGARENTPPAQAARKAISAAVKALVPQLNKRL